MFDDRLRAALRRITTPLPLLALGSWTQVLAFAQVLPVNPSPPAASHQELRVRGRVVDALGGAVAAADVWLADEDGREIGRTRCDGLGVFFFDEPAASARSVHATAPGTIVARVDLGPENRSVAIELRLWDAATLRGRVLDDAGAPIAGAHVVAVFARCALFTRWAQATAITDAEGAFVCDKVPLGMVDVRAMAAGHIYGTRCVAVASDTETELRLQRGEGTTVTLRLRGVPPEDFGAVRFGLSCQGPQRPVVLPGIATRGRPDEQGVWRVAGLPPFGFVVSVSSPRHAFARGDGTLFETKVIGSSSPWVFPRKVQRDPVPEAHVAEFVATPAGAVRVRGRLLAPEGHPLRGQRVELDDPFGFHAEATTGDDGRFAVAAPAAQSQAWLRVAGGRWFPEGGMQDVAYPLRSGLAVQVDPEAEVRVVPVARVRGQLVGAEGAPASDVPVVIACCATLGPMSHPLWQAVAASATDADGHFVFDGVAPLQTDVRVETAWPLDAVASQVFALQPGAVCDVGRIALRPAFAVAGRVVDAAGEPVAGAQVFLRQEVSMVRARWASDSSQGVARPEVISARDGRFRFPSVSAGTYTVTAEHADAATAARPLTVTAAAVSPIELRLPPRR